MSDLQIGLQAATAVMVFGALLLLLVIHFVRRDGLQHPRLAQFRAEEEAAYRVLEATQKSGLAVPGAKHGIPHPDCR